MKYTRHVLSTKNALHKNVKWLDEKGKSKGFGYYSPRQQYYSLLRCPHCELQNYVMGVARGICYICNFDANHPLDEINWQPIPE